MSARSAAAGSERESLLANGHADQPRPQLRDDPRKWVRLPASAAYLTWEVLRSNVVNWLLVFVPLGIVAGAVGWNPTAVFVLNFLAIIPLASLLSFATEELSVKLGQTLGGLLNASFGNAVELIVSVVALRNNEIRIVQSSMLGSILSNILLVLGCCFVAGGIKRDEQFFNSTVASTMSSLMAVSCASLIIPATLSAVMAASSKSHDDAQERLDDILLLSRGTAIILLLLYVLYLYFQLRSHAWLFDVESKPSGDEHRGSSSGNERGSTNRPQDEGANENNDDDDAEPNEPELLSPTAAAVALVVVTLMVAVCAEYLVDSIDAIVATAHISKTFIGLVLLPIVGNAAEHVTAVVVSYKNKMDLAIGVAIGSSMQIALLVTPGLVMLGWAMGRDMTLRFETFETVVFFLSVLVVNYLIQDGKSNYLEGAMLIGTYIIIALAFYVYPDNTSAAPGTPPLDIAKGLFGGSW